MNWIVTATIETAPDQPIIMASDLMEARELTASWIRGRRHIASPVLVGLNFWRRNGLTGAYELQFSEAPANG
jgi:hypothetical protein